MGGPVIPAQAGIPLASGLATIGEIPAFAGMTKEKLS